MKPNVHLLPRPARRGIALLTVLALLTLTSILILAFFSVSQTELRSTAAYAGGAEAQQLAKTAVDLVMHQVRAATEDAGAAWASQPGAIRVWGKNRGTESEAVYKLYSDDSMTEIERRPRPDEPSPQLIQKLDQDYTDIKEWEDSRYKDIFVDLNEPILRANADQAGNERVKVYYPIVDPRAYYEGSQKQMVTRSDWDQAPAADNMKWQIEGFYFETTDIKRDPYPKRDGTRIDHYVGLPMPVKWLYQLKDGTLGTLDHGSAARPRFKAVSGEGEPSQNNPMVGRIAFWADDESCKLNVNTAAGGSPWDTPRAGGRTDREDFGAKQPVQREYQRYPGHPATTSLAPVLFPNRNRAGEGARIGRAGAMDVAQAHEKIYEMIARVEPGGSQGGLDFWNTDEPPIVPTDNDRLYATIDEFIFHATKTSSQGLREIQEAAGSWGQLDGEFLDRTKFFLTTGSRAPEVTVFNTPRLSIWPSYYEQSYGSYANSKRLTEFDRRIRFCAEVGRRPNDFGDQYHFQRRNAHSATEDYEDIPRNRELFSYLLWLMKQEIPGIGKSLESKYGDDEVQQIATEIFDYIRCTNLFDDMLFENPGAPSPKTAWGNNPKDHLAYTNNRVNVTNNLLTHTGHGQVAPIEITKDGETTKGFGRFYSINEVGVAFIATASVPEDDADPDIVLGGRKNNHFKDNGSSWSDSVAGYTFDYSNVPPFSRKDLKSWDGHVLDPANPEDALIIADQNWVGSRYGGGFNYTHFEGKAELWNYLIKPENWNYTLDRDEPLKNKGDRRVQAILLFSMFCPSKGWTGINPDFCLDVETDGFKANGVDLFPEASGTFTLKSLASYYHYWDHRPMGGLLPPVAFLIGQAADSGNLDNQMARYSPDLDFWEQEMEDDGATFDPKQGPDEEALSFYPWVSDPFTVLKSSDFRFEGGTVSFKLYPGGGFNFSEGKANQPSQYVEVKMKDCPLPRPNIAESKAGEVLNGKTVPNTQIDNREYWSFSRVGAFLNIRDGGNSKKPARGRLAFYRNRVSYDGQLIMGEVKSKGDTEDKFDVVRSYVIPHGDYRLALAKKESGSGTPDLTSEGSSPDFVPHVGYDDSTVFAACAFSNCARSYGYGRSELHRDWENGWNKNPLAKTPKSPQFSWHLEPQIPKNIEDKSDYESRWGDWDNTTAAENDGPFINKPDEGNSRGISLANYVNQAYARYGYAPRRFIPYYTEPHQQEPPGASFFSPNRIMPGAGMFGSLPTGVAYSKKNPGTPKPWQTLLFRPLPDNGRKDGKTHPGYEDPKDHYILDFFWMPVVEPWSISEPFSTAGKVNMNYAMLPFAHIKRASGVIGVMFSEQMLTIPSDQGDAYKGAWGRGKNYNWITDTGGTLTNPSLRSFIDHLETLKQFDAKFRSPTLSRIEPGLENRGDLFRTASELCEMWLVPDPINPPNDSVLKHDFKLTDVQNWWDQDNEKGFTLVGDNSRERPYTLLLARLTTKSNTFQVHYRAQVIKQAPTSPVRPGERRNDDEYETFDSDVDGIIAEYRGSTIIERYIDPNEKLGGTDGVPDYAELVDNNPGIKPGDGDLKSLDRFYRFRILSEKRFAP